jgi:hypothetical protein
MNYSQNTLWKLIKFQDGCKVDEFTLSERDVKEIIQGKENKAKKMLLLRI